MGRADGRKGGREGEEAKGEGGGGGAEKPWGRWRNVTTAAGASPGVDVDLFPVRERGRRIV